MSRRWFGTAAIGVFAVAGLAAAGLAVASASGTENPQPKPGDIVPVEVRQSGGALVSFNDVSDEERTSATEALKAYEPLKDLLASGAVEIQDFASWKTELSPPHYTQRRLGVVVSVLFAQPTALPTDLPGLVNQPENPDAPEQPAAKVDGDGVPVAGPQPADQLQKVQAALVFVLLPEGRVHATVPVDRDSASLTPSAGDRIQSSK